jgi:glucose-1-phosphate adenylyltransferase
MKADLSISCIDVPKSEARRFGIVVADAKYNIKSIVEKPADPPEIPNKPGFSFVNMGIYVFNANILRDVFDELNTKKIKSHDFIRDVIPYLVGTGRKVEVYKFQDENRKIKPYWKDIGTIDSYYESNMDLISISPEFNLYDAEWPLRTYQYQFPPAKNVSHEEKRIGRVLNSLICDGCIIPHLIFQQTSCRQSVSLYIFYVVIDTLNIT